MIKSKHVAPVKPARRWSVIGERTPVGVVVATVVLLGIALGWGALFQTLARQESEAIAAAAVANVNLARAFNEHVLRIVRDVDLQSRVLAQHVQRHGMSNVDLVAFQRDISPALPFVIRIGLIDASGYIVASSEPIARVYRGDREHFRAIQDNISDSPFVGTPIIGRRSKEWWVPMTRRLNTADGKYAGALMFAVDPQYFARFYSTVSLGKNGVVTLYRNDGIVLARQPDPTLSIGKNVGSLPDVKIFLSQKAGFRVTEGAFDGIRRVMAFNSLSDYPLTVSVGTSLAEVLAPLNNRRPRYYLFAAAIAAYFALGGGAIAWLFKRRRLAEDALRDSEQQVRHLNAALERRVVKRTAALEAAVREMETFTYTVAHDLRSPLRAMSAYANILSEHHGKNLSAEDSGYLESLAENAKRMGQMIDDLLALSSYSHRPLSKQDVDIEGLANKVLAEQVPVDRRIEARVGALPPCNADPQMLRTLLTSLISNAIKFTRTVSSPAIEIGHADGAFFVRDNGVGFDMAYAGKLFGVFNRLHLREQYQGTGIGLAIVKCIVERHGGRVWAHAELGKGATFYFTLGQA